MKGFKIEINFDDLVDDMFCDAEYDEFGASPSYSFKDALKEDIIRQVSSKIIPEIKQTANDEVKNLASDQVKNFVSGELDGIIQRKLRKGEINTRYDGFKTFDEIIEKQLDRMNIENVIERHISAKADVFAKEMKARYDNVFAARIVGSLKEQKMLSPDVARILLGDDD
jgi:hypothetical protein